MSEQKRLLGRERASEKPIARAIITGIYCRICDEKCDVCETDRYCGDAAHLMRMEGLVWRCDRGHEQPRDGAEEMMQAGIEPMI